MHRYASQNAGEIVKFWKIAETASKRDERRAFKEVIAYAKKHAATLDGVLFFKVDVLDLEAEALPLLLAAGDAGEGEESFGVHGVLSVELCGGCRVVVAGAPPRPAGVEQAADRGQDFDRVGGCQRLGVVVPPAVEGVGDQFGRDPGGRAQRERRQGAARRAVFRCGDVRAGRAMRVARVRAGGGKVRGPNRTGLASCDPSFLTENCSVRTIGATAWHIQAQGLGHFGIAYNTEVGEILLRPVREYRTALSDTNRLAGVLGEPQLKSLLLSEGEYAVVRSDSKPAAYPWVVTRESIPAARFVSDQDAVIIAWAANGYPLWTERLNEWRERWKSRPDPDQRP